MATTTTTYLSLIKPTPGTGEPIHVADLNTNADIIDRVTGPVYSVKKYGALGDGTTDDGPAIRAAMTAAAATGGVVFFPGGPTTVYSLGAAGGTVSLTLASNVTLRGDGATIRRRAGNAERLLAGAGALSDVAIRDLVIDNQDAVVGSGGCLQVANGSTRITLERVRFVRLAAAGAVLVDQGATQNVRVRITDCSFERTLANGTYAAENINTVQILDTSDLWIARCRFDTVNGLQISAQTAAACTSTNPMRDIYLTDCVFEHVKSTCVFVQTNAVAAHVRGVHLIGNSFLTVGKEIEKGAIAILPTTSGSFRDVEIRGNVIRDWGISGTSPLSATAGYTANAAQAITMGAGTAPLDGVVVADNQIDAAAQDGTVPTAGNYGIDVGTNVRGLVIRGNAVRNCGHDGIRLNGGTGVEVTRFVVSDNLVTGCCLGTPASGFTAGIHVVDNVLWGVISGNNCLDNGASGMAAFQAAGIGVDQPTSAATVANLTITGNQCIDTRGTKLQKYGILLGRAGGAPGSLSVVGNNVRGNLTLDFSYPNIVEQHVAHNRGYLEATAASTMTGSIGAGTTAVQSVTVTGAVFGDQVIVGHTGIGTGVDGLVLSARVVAADTVRVMLSNVTAGAITGPAGDLRVLVEHYRGST